MKLIEIARSYSRKKNIGNYETIDYFCSAKEEVPKSKAEKTSEELFQFCRGEVEKSVAEYQKENAPAESKPFRGRFPTKAEAEAVDREAERIIAEGVSDEEKNRLREAEEEIFNQPPET